MSWQFTRRARTRFPTAPQKKAEWMGRGNFSVSVGKVYLVGAGPGDPDLLTVKALRLIQTADVILHDDLVPQAILDHASPFAEIVNVGKRCGTKTITQDEINALMIDHAREESQRSSPQERRPAIFGRAAEEMAALTEADVPFEIVPGITAAFAAAAAIGCSLTNRHSASNVIFSTGHHAQSHNRSPLPELEDATRVVYMPGRDLTLLAQEWLQQGLPPDFPCAIVSHAAQPGQQVLHTTLPNSAMPRLLSRPACSLPAGLCERSPQQLIRQRSALSYRMKSYKLVSKPRAHCILI